MKDSSFEKVLADFGKDIDRKNASYGNSFSKSIDFLKLFWPDEIKKENYEMAFLLVRLFDKIGKITVDKDSFGDDSYSDLIGLSYRICNEGKYKGSIEYSYAEYDIETPEFIALQSNIAKELYEKREMYGPTEKNVGKMLRVLYPNGVLCKDYEAFLLNSKLLEKMSRLSSGSITKNASADCLFDIIGYAALGLQFYNE